MGKKSQPDVDRDSAIGFSVFTSGKSTTISEVTSLFQLSNQQPVYITLYNYTFLQWHCIDVATHFVLVTIGSSGQRAGGTGV